MTTEGNKTLYNGIPKIKDAFIILIKTEWNAPIVDKLEEGAATLLRANGIEYKTLIVPGAVEIPFAIKAYANSNQRKADAFIAFGAVIKGDTPHFDFVCKLVTEGILQLNLQLSSPVIMGVLTVNTPLQAEERTGGIHGHKGEEAAIAAIKMIGLQRQFNKG